MGRNRSTVANLLRLLQLPPDVQALVHERRLSEGHARALLGLSDTERQLGLATEAVEQGWSVREVEAVVAGQNGPSSGRRDRAERPAGRPSNATAEVKRVEDALRKHLGTDVRVTAVGAGAASSPSATTPTTISPACSS